MKQTLKSTLSQAVALRLFLANRFMLLAYLNSITKKATLSEKILQDVGVLVLEKYTTVVSLDDFRPWIRDIARSQLLKAMHQSKSTQFTAISDGHFVQK